jgi:intein/homing endonuclease
MRHKVTKKLYKLASASGNTVIVTGDHSIMVERNGEIIPITAKELNVKTDKLIVDVYYDR